LDEQKLKIYLEYVFHISPITTYYVTLPRMLKFHVINTQQNQVIWAYYENTEDYNSIRPRLEIKREGRKKKMAEQ